MLALRITIGLVVLAFVGMAVVGSHESPQPPSRGAAAAPVPQSIPAPATPVDADAVLKKARALLARMVRDNRPHSTAEALKEGMIAKSEIADVKQSLVDLGSAVPTRKAEAQKLLDGILRAEAEGKRLMEAAIAKAIADDAGSRKDYAKRLEANFLAGGFDVSVSASGPKATTLTLRFVLFSRPLVFQLINDGAGHESELVTTWRKLGFKRALFTDGYDHSWSIVVAGSR